MAEYQFLTRWHLDAPIDEVWAAIRDVESYPKWWKYVAEAEQMTPGDEKGLGERLRYHWTSALPYTFDFQTETTKSEPPRLLETTATGDIEGFGRWELAEAEQGTVVHYTWNVRTTEAWINALAPLAKPIFVWNHGMLMRAGGEGLARHLGVKLLENVPQVSAQEAAQRSGAPGATGEGGASGTWRLVAAAGVLGLMAVAASRVLRGR